MALKIGNILNKSNLTSVANRFMGGSASENLAGAASLGAGLKSIGKSILDEAYGPKSDSSYSSQFPLGDEWRPDPAYIVTIVFTDPNTGQTTDVQGYMPETISMGLGAEFSSPLESVGEAMSSGVVGMTARMFGYKVSANIFSMLLWSGSSHIDMTLELRFVALADTYEDVIEPIRKLYSLVTPTIESFSVTKSPVQLGMVMSPGPSLEFAGTTSVTENVSNVANLASNAAGKISGSLVSNVSNLIDGSTTGGQAVANIAGATVEAGGSAINQALKDLRVKNNIAITLGQFAYLRSVVVKDVSPAYNVKADDDGNWTDATVSVQISTFISPTNIDIPDLVGYGSRSPNKASTDGTEVSSDLAALAGGGIAGAITKVSSSPLSKLTSLAESAGLNVKFPSIGEATKNLQVNPQTQVAQIKNELFDNISSIGKDSGLASKVISGGVSFSLGMSDTEASAFKRNMLNV